MKRYIFVLLSCILISGCSFIPQETYYQTNTYSKPTTTQIEQYEKTSSFDTDTFIWEDFQQ